MKKIIAVLLLMACANGFSQKGEHRAILKKASASQLTPEQTATLQTKKMTLALDLSKAQQKQLQKVNFENVKLRKEKMATLKKKKESGELKKLTSEERYTATNKRLDYQIEQREKMREILTPEQYQKWKKLSAKKSAESKKRMMMLKKRKMMMRKK